MDTDENPFADPAVINATRKPTTIDSHLEDYNPFESSSPSVKNNAAPPPVYSESGQQKVTTADFEELKRRQEELERRAKELERREEELKNSSLNIRQNNWPPLPSCLPVKPCFYQDIHVDIPVEFQQIVKYLYSLWIWHITFLLVNVLIGLLYMFIDFSNGGPAFGLSLFYFIIFTPASFLCWFRPVYKAFRSDSSFNFMVFFFVFFFQCIVSIVSTIGITALGNGGLITTISLLKSERGALIFIGVLMLFSTLGFALAAGADIYLLLRIHRLYRSTGASLSKAQAEFTSGVLGSDVVRQAAADAASAGFRSNFGGGTSQQPGTGGGGGGPTSSGDFRY